MYNYLTYQGVTTMHAGVDGEYDISYRNSVIGREELARAGLPPDELAEIMAVWGSRATVPEKPEQYPALPVSPNGSIEERMDAMQAQQLAIMEGLVETYEMLLGGMEL